MRYEYTYDIHKSLEAERVRRRERQLGHQRALRRAGPSRSFASRMIDGLGRLRSLSASRSVAVRRSEISYEAQVLTDKVCRLADGSLGRVAVRRSNGEWVETCVPTHHAR